MEINYRASTKKFEFLVGKNYINRRDNYYYSNIKVKIKPIY